MGDRPYVYCGHKGCTRRAVEVYAYERDGSEFKGQTHDCCTLHSERLLTPEEIWGTTEKKEKEQ